MKTPTLEALVQSLVPKAYWVPAVDDVDSDSLRVSIEQRRSSDGRVRWAVLRNDLVLNVKGQWEYEPLPSSRDEAFLKRCRYEELGLACLALMRWLNNLQKEKHDPPRRRPVRKGAKVRPQRS